MRFLIMLAIGASLLFLTSAAISAAAKATAAVARHLRLLLVSLGLSLSSGIAVGAITSQNPAYDPIASGFAGAGLLFTPILLALSALDQRRRNHRVWTAPAEPANRSPIASIPPLAPAARAKNASAARSWFGRWRNRPEDERHQGIAEAWALLAPITTHAASRVAVARASCERLLDAADAAPLSPELIEWAAFIRKRLPELVGSGLAEYRRAAPAERGSVAEDLVASLERIGAEADRRLSSFRRAARSDFDIQREHVARRTSIDPFAP